MCPATSTHEMSANTSCVNVADVRVVSENGAYSTMINPVINNTERQPAITALLSFWPALYFPMSFPRRPNDASHAPSPGCQRLNVRASIRNCRASRPRKPMRRTIGNKRPAAICAYFTTSRFPIALPIGVMYMDAPVAINTSTTLAFAQCSARVCRSKRLGSDGFVIAAV